MSTVTSLPVRELGNRLSPARRKPCLPAPTKQTLFRIADRKIRAIESQANQALELHPHFHNRCQTLSVRCAEQCLQISGYLPSFYLKQLAQEAIRRVADAHKLRIVNEIVVLSSVGEVGPIEREEARKANKAEAKADRQRLDRKPR